MTKVFIFSFNFQSSSLACSLLLENAVIKGYHSYKIIPPETEPATELMVDREYTNIKDVNSCLVWVPPLDSFPPTLHSMLTDEKRHLQLVDIAGLPVGHVPRGLARAFRTLLDEGGSVTALILGPPVPSFPPWPSPNETGGGVVIPCNYKIYCHNEQRAFELIKKELKSMPEVEVMRLTVLT